MTQIIKKSYCHLCLAHCGIKVTLDDKKIIKIVSDFDDPVSKGYICEKAQKLIGYQHSKDRITEPLKKINGEFVSISWDQAIEEIVDKIKTFKQRDSILYMSPSATEYRSVYKLELMRKLGAKFVTNIFSVEKMYPSFVESTLLHSHVEPDRKNSQVHIIIGQNPWVTQHYPRARKVLLDIKNNPNRKLIVIDPCDTDTTKISDYHIKINPGSDAWVMIALIKLLIDNNYIDFNFINKQTINYDKVLKYFSQINLNECLMICGISYEKLFEIAKLIYLADGGVSLTSGNGICHTPNALANNYLFCLLYLLTGNYQKLGGMITVDSCISQGMISNQYFDEPKIPWGSQKQFAGVTPASAVVDNLYIDEDRHFDCVFIDNTNPVGRFPNSDKLISQLNKIDLVVALDSFYTQSTPFADYILPVPTHLESYEICAMDTTIARLSEPIISTKHPAAERIYEIFLEKLDLLDHKEIKELISLYNSDKIKFVEILAKKFQDKIPIVYYVLYRTVGAHCKNPILSLLWWKIFIVNKETNSIEQALTVADTAIDSINNIGWAKIDTSINNNYKVIDLTGTYLLSSLKSLNLETLNPDYKFMLQCGYRQKDSMNGMIPNINAPLLEVNSEDLRLLGIEDGEQIMLKTESAEIQIKCKADKNLQSRLIRIANHAIINKLSNTKNRDYLNPQYKLVFANIRKINGIG